MKKTNGYKIDFSNNTITINYTFAAAASQFGTDEYETLKKIRDDFPQMAIITKSGRKKSPKRKSNKGLTYKHMETYIRTRKPEKLKHFEKVKAMSATAKSPYKYVCDWFKGEFPNYANAPKAKKEKATEKSIHTVERELNDAA